MDWKPWMDAFLPALLEAFPGRVAFVGIQGSYGRGEAGPDSDVDLLVEFTTPRVSLLTLNGVKYRLEELLGTEVDVVHGPLPKSSILEIDKRISVYGA